MSDSSGSPEMSETSEISDRPVLGLSPERTRPQPSVDEVRLRQWIGRIVEHDEKALGCLYEAMIGRVYGLVLRIVRNAQTAEEVAEDTFWQAWRQAPRFDAARGNASAWLLTIARSRALDALRRADRAENHAEPERLIDAELLNDADPQDLLAASQSGQRLHQALAGLDPLPRQQIALAFFQGLTHEEIAIHTGLPLGTVKSHLRRTLAALRRLLSCGPACVNPTP